jgi:hypothetical protein
MSSTTARYRSSSSKAQLRPPTGSESQVIRRRPGGRSWVRVMRMQPGLRRETRRKRPVLIPDLPLREVSRCACAAHASLALIRRSGGARAPIHGRPLRHSDRNRGHVLQPPVQGRWRLRSGSPLRVHRAERQPATGAVARFGRLAQRYAHASGKLVLLGRAQRRGSALHGLVRPQ